LIKDDSNHIFDKFKLGCMRSP